MYYSSGGCYSCSGANCPKEMNASDTSNVVACPGLGESAACYVSYILSVYLYLLRLTVGHDWIE